MKKHALSKNQRILSSFAEENFEVFVRNLSETKWKIIQFLHESYYPASIARKLKLSRSYVSRFVKELLTQGLIYKDYINAITKVAVSYRLSEFLKTYLVRITDKKPNLAVTLAIPHNIRYKFPIVGKTKKIALTTGRFAASKLKLVKEFCMVGGVRYVYNMRHESIGGIGVIVHPSSLVVYQKERHPIRAASSAEATNLVAIALSEVAQRFVQEQAWENVSMELGQPKLVGSPHYAFNSNIAKRVVAAGQSMLQVGKEFEIDESLKAKGITDLAEIETTNAEEANLVDKGLRIAADIENIVPALIQKELRSVSESILGMNDRAEKIDEMCNNVAALCQSGTPLQQQFNMLQTQVARQGESIHLMQETMLKMVENMSSLIAKISNP